MGFGGGRFLWERDRDRKKDVVVDDGGDELREWYGSCQLQCLLGSEFSFAGKF